MGRRGMWIRFGQRLDRVRGSTRSARASCPNAPHDRGLVYDPAKDVAVCLLCGHEQWEEMGG